MAFSNSVVFHIYIESIRVFLVMNSGVWKTYLILVKKLFSMENGTVGFLSINSQTYKNDLNWKQVWKENVEYVYPTQTLGLV